MSTYYWTLRAHYLPLSWAYLCSILCPGQFEANYGLDFLDDDAIENFWLEL